MQRPCWRRTGDGCLRWADKRPSIQFSSTAEELSDFFNSAFEPARKLALSLACRRSTARLCSMFAVALDWLLDWRNLIDEGRRRLQHQPSGRLPGVTILVIIRATIAPTKPSCLVITPLQLVSAVTAARNRIESIDVSTPASYGGAAVSVERRVLCIDGVIVGSRPLTLRPIVPPTSSVTIRIEKEVRGLEENELQLVPAARIRMQDPAAPVTDDAPAAFSTPSHCGLRR